MSGPFRTDPRSPVSSGRFLALLWACGLTTQWPPRPGLPGRPGDHSKARCAAVWTPGRPPDRTQETKICPSSEPGDLGKSCHPWAPEPLLTEEPGRWTQLWVHVGTCSGEVGPRSSEPPTPQLLVGCAPLPTTPMRSSLPGSALCWRVQLRVNPGLIPGSGRSPGGGNGNLLQCMFSPGESHGQRSLAGHSPWSSKESDTSEQQVKGEAVTRWSFRLAPPCPPLHPSSPRDSPPTAVLRIFFHLSSLWTAPCSGLPSDTSHNAPLGGSLLRPAHLVVVSSRPLRGLPFLADPSSPLEIGPDAPEEAGLPRVLWSPLQGPMEDLSLLVM